MGLRTSLRLAWILALAPLADADAIRNVNQPGVTYSSLQAAINAAHEGDLLLVQADFYGSATIDGKSLSIVAMPLGIPQTGTLKIVNLGPEQRVLVSGLTIFSSTSVGLNLADNQGHVRIQNCKIFGGDGGSPSVPNQPGLRATQCARVVITGCEIIGGSSNYPAGFDARTGGHGVEAIDSSIALYDCKATGGLGSYLSLPAGGHGGDGLHITGWGAFLSGTELRGGRGGEAGVSSCIAGGQGGDALDVTSAQVQLLDVSLIPGEGGPSLCQPGEPGLTIDNHAGVVTELPGERRELTIKKLASDASPLAITLEGQPGDKVWLFSSYAPGHAILPGLGIWTVKRPAFVPMTPLGVVGASGTLAVNAPVHALPAGAPGGTLYVQALVVDSSGKGFLSSPRHVGVVDAASGPDCDGSQVNDFVELFTFLAGDCDHNLEIDTCDIASGAQKDCNGNQVPDQCELENGVVQDCNGNQIPDSCDIANGLSQDCNGNGKPDSCDISSGTSHDVNHNGIPDECEPTTPVTWWVDDDAPAGGNGSQAQPFQQIGSAIALAFHGDTVLVRDGVYRGAGNKELTLGGREIVVRSQNGPAACIIDLQGAGRAFRIVDHEGPLLRIEGFTIRNGNSQGSPLDKTLGGGIRIDFASPLIVNCVIENCRSMLGGGVYASGSPQVRDTLIRGCKADGDAAAAGGGIYLRSSFSGELPGALVRCVLEECTSQGRGGAFAYTGYERFLVSHCKFLANTAKAGGAISASDQVNGGGPTLFMDDCLVAGNQAERGGGLAFAGVIGAAGNAGWNVTGCTLVQNSASLQGGALYLSTNSTSPFAELELFDTIVWGSSAPLGPTLCHAGTIGEAVVEVEWCDVQGGEASFAFGSNASFSYGPGNRDADPLFVDPDGPDNDPLTFADNDYRLAAGSPCCDAGSNALTALDGVDLDGDGILGEPTPFDLLMQPRFVEEPLAPNTGLGTPPLIDLGAFERQP